MVSLIIGHGANRLAIPLMAFENSEHAHDFLVALGLEMNKKDMYHLPEPIPENVQKALFKFYYDGCGGCYALSVQTVDFGVPVVGWDLD